DDRQPLMEVSSPHLAQTLRVRPRHHQRVRRIRPGVAHGQTLPAAQEVNFDEVHAIEHDTLTLAQLLAPSLGAGSLVTWREYLGRCDQALLRRGFVDLDEGLAVFLLNEDFHLHRSGILLRLGDCRAAPPPRGFLACARRRDADARLERTPGLLLR